MAKPRGPHKAQAKTVPPKFRRTFIKQWRIAQGLTVEALAEKAKLGNGTVSGIENGTQGYSAESLSKLADALKVGTGELLNVDPSTGPAMWSIWLKADRAQREHITELAETVIKSRRGKDEKK